MSKIGDKILVKSRDAEGVIQPFSVLHYGTAANQVIPGDDQASPVAGLSDNLGQPTDGDCVDVISPIGNGVVQLGGAVAYGQEMICNANARGVAITDAVPGVAYIFGIAQEAGVAGDQILFQHVGYKVTVV